MDTFETMLLDGERGGAACRGSTSQGSSSASTACRRSSLSDWAGAGFDPSTQPALAATSGCDYLVLGDGEIPMASVMDALATGNLRRLAPGVAKVTDGRIVGETEHSHDSRMEELEPPDRSLLDFERYLVRSQRYLHGYRTASIVTSRGCPFDCEFCSVHPVCGRRWRPVSAGRVLGEIERLVTDYSVNNVEIEDDNFTLHKGRAMEILSGIQAMNRRGMDLSWRAFNGLRIDTLDGDLIRMMRQSNCRHVNLPVEHGDPEVLRLMNKKLDLERVANVAVGLHEAGISCSFFVIYGYPGETAKRFENALRFYRTLRKLTPRFGFIPLVAQPFPGTRLHARAVREGLLSDQMFDSTDLMPHFDSTSTIWMETDDFDQAEIRRRGKLLHRELLGGSAYLRHRIKNTLPPKWVNGFRSAYQISRRMLEAAT